MGWVFNATPRPLYLLERDLAPFVQEAGWASRPIWTVRKVRTESNWLRIVTIGGFF